MNNNCNYSMKSSRSVNLNINYLCLKPGPRCHMLKRSLKNNRLHSEYLVEEMLFANCSNFANVVDKAYGSLRGSVAFADTNVPEAVQEIGPGICPDPIPHGDPHIVIPVTVALEEEIDR